MSLTNPFPRFPIKAVTPAEWGAQINYLSPVWDHPTKGPIVVDDISEPWRGWVIHHGGGPNQAGDPDNDPDPGLTWGQKLAVWLGFGARVLRAWERYHIGKGWRGIAYDIAIHPRSGRVYILREFKQNGAQRGSYWNSHTLACVYILGSGQKPKRRARRTFAGLWFIFPGRVRGHKDTCETPGCTACPGDVYPFIQDDFQVREVWRPSYRVGSRNKMYQFVKVRMADLGYYNLAAGSGKVWTEQCRRSLSIYQQDRGLPVTGKMNEVTVRRMVSEGLV